MTSISSLTPYSDINSISQMFGSQSQSSAASVQNQSATGNIFGSAFSLSLSDAGLNAMNDSNSPGAAGASSSDILSALTYSGSGNSAGGVSSFEAMLDNYTSSSTPGSSDASSGSDPLSNFINQVFSSVENSLEDIGSNPSTDAQAATATATNTTFDTSSTSFAEQALASGGPLPAFLKEVDTQMHLDSTQQQALQNIADEYQNANNTPDTVNSIAMALQQAGI